MLRFLLPFFLAFSAMAASAQDVILRQQVDVPSDTHVEVLSLFNKPAGSGYLPVRVKLANNLTGERSVTLSFTSTSQYPDEITTNSSFTLSAPGEKTVLHDILVPLCPASERSSNVVLNVRLTGSFGIGFGSLRGDLNSGQPAVLMSEALFTTNASALDAEATKALSASSSVEFAGKFDPKQLPDSWLAYSGYDTVLMTDGDWSNIHPGGRNAILSWVRLGGHLIIHSSTSPTLAALDLPADPSAGRIDITRIPASLALSPEVTIKQVMDDKPLAFKRESFSSDFGSGWPLQAKFGLKAFRYALFVIVLIIFGILVGPINLFVLAKSGRRHRLFITTPLISLGASLILIALIIFQDGFGGNGERIVLMEVRPDGDQNAAFVVQEQFARTGVLTKSNFRLDTPANFLPVPISSSRWARLTTEHRGNKGTFNLQPDGAGSLISGDWFQSRSEHGHQITAVVPTRGRIETSSSPDQMVSTFDYPIKDLYYLDKAGKWHRANSIQTGKAFVISPVEFPMVDPELTTLQNSLSKRNAQAFAKLRGRKGCFIAVTEEAPGIATQSSIRWKKTTTIITGPVVTP